MYRPLCPFAGRKWRWRGRTTSTSATTPLQCSCGWKAAAKVSDFSHPQPSPPACCQLSTQLHIGSAAQRAAAKLQAVHLLTPYCLLLPALAAPCCSQVFTACNCACARLSSCAGDFAQLAKAHRVTEPAALAAPGIRNDNVPSSAAAPPGLPPPAPSNAAHRGCWSAATAAVAAAALALVLL